MIYKIITTYNIKGGEQHMEKKEKVISFIIRIKYVFKLLSGLKIKLLVGSAIICVINAILPYLSMINTQEIINYIQIGESMSVIKQRLIIFLVLGIISIISSNLYSYFMTKYKEYLYLELNKKFLKETFKFDLQDYENPSVYDMIQRAEQEIGQRPYSVAISFLAIIGQVVNLVSAFVILITWHPFLVFGFIILSVVASKYFTSISKNEYNVLMNRTNYERKSWYIAHLLIKDEYIKEVKLFDLSNYLLENFKKLRGRFYNENLTILKKQITFSQCYQLFNYLVTFCIVCLAIYESSIGLVLVGTTMTYINTTSKIETAIKSLVSSLFSIYKDSLYIENIKMFFDYESMCENGDIIIDKIDTIEFKNVSFIYPNRSEYALKNISFKIKKGDILAIVGENGSGKTTLIKLLNGLYDNYVGNILINDTEMRKINKESLRKCLATLFQDYNKYQFTIMENVGFGAIENLNNKEMIKNSSKKGGAIDFINRLPNQYEQQVGYWFEGGTQLSGGQWQKLGLSRLFMKDSDCFILDEPTASLDPFSELEIFKQLYKNSKDKINIIITHRFINVNFTNKIIVIKNGTIVEQGTHEELINKKGFYSDMYMIQSKGIMFN